MFTTKYVLVRHITRPETRTMAITRSSTLIRDDVNARNTRTIQPSGNNPDADREVESESKSESESETEDKTEEHQNTNTKRNRKRNS